MIKTYLSRKFIARCMIIISAMITIFFVIKTVVLSREPNPDSAYWIFLSIINAIGGFSNAPLVGIPVLLITLMINLNPTEDPSYPGQRTIPGRILSFIALYLLVQVVAYRLIFIVGTYWDIH